MTVKESSKPELAPICFTQPSALVFTGVVPSDTKGRDWRDEGFATNNNGAYITDNIWVKGCVATAMTQMFYYWNYPNSCPALDGYDTWPHKWSMKALLETTFDWDAMKKSYSYDETGSSATAVAALLRYCS